MKATGLMLICAMLVLSGCARKKFTSWRALKNPKVAAQIKSFVAEKQAQADAASEAKGHAMPSEFKSYFAAAAKGDWLTISNEFEIFSKHAPQYYHPGSTDDLNLRGTAWQGVMEIHDTLEYMAVADEKYSVAYANDIIDSIPPGSIYFGGTDPGRFLITGMEKSQVNGDPFFLLTQNALADGTYLDYLRSMYGDKIYIPTKEDLQNCFEHYTRDVQLRNQQHRLKPGENFKMVDGKLQIEGPNSRVAVMTINGLLAKVIFDKNPDRGFYIEQSFPLDWMYPYLEPHGLIFKLNRQPLPDLSDEIVQQDHDYWTKLIQPMIGGWLNDDTPVQEVADFAKKVFLRHDFGGFTGDPQFVQNGYTCKMFSKERGSIADLYVWRMNHATHYGERERMARAADFAFRQALALCPYNRETVRAYTDFLKKRNRGADAALVGKMAQQFR